MKNLYFKIPFCSRARIERIIINHLKCPCYKVVGRDKFFSNDEGLLIRTNGKLVFVSFLSENPKLVEKVKRAFYTFYR